MASPIGEFGDLLRTLQEHPEWGAELRRAVLSEEVLALPLSVRALADAQARTDERLARIEEALQTLAAAQARTEERLGRVEEALAALAEAQVRTEERVTALAAAQERAEQHLGAMASALQDLTHHVDPLRGMVFEQRHIWRPFAYFGRFLRRAHALSDDELEALLDAAIAERRLSPDEADEVLRADAVVRGRRREDGAEVYLVAEVSWGIGLGDVERAAERAALLAKAGLPVIPVVAGVRLTPDARKAAEEMAVIPVLNRAEGTP